VEAMSDYDIEDLDGFHVEDWDDELEALNSYPVAGPVTVTRADGATEVQDPLEGGDAPGCLQ
jgi:hypothetical protein